MSSADYCGCDDAKRAALFICPVGDIRSRDHIDATPQDAVATEVIGDYCRFLALEWRRAGDEAQAAAYDRAAMRLGVPP